MKLPKLILAALFVATAAQAQNYQFDIPEGRVILEPQPCRVAGREATMIESRANGGGAYGCWVRDGDKIHVVWTQLLGPTGSVLNTKLHKIYDAPPSMQQDSRGRQ